MMEDILTSVQHSWLTLSLVLSIVLSFVISSSIICNNCPILKKKAYLSGRILFVTAHPDDECMFFGPSVLSAVENGRSVHLLCLSTGERGTTVPSVFVEVCWHG